MNNKVITNELRPDQIAAIKRGKLIGARLARDTPEIKEDYVNGMFILDIVKKYGIIEKYCTTRAVARSATQVALRNLIGYSELEFIAKDHMEHGGRIRGVVSMQMKQGIFGEVNRDSSQWTKDSIKAGKAGAVSRGQIPWIEREVRDNYVRFSELEYLEMLSKNPDYQRGSYTNRKRISRELNRVYHDGKDIRSVGAVSSALHIIKKGKKASYKK